MNDLESRVIALNDEYTLGVLAEMKFYILLADSDNVSYEFRKYNIQQALYTFVNARVSVWAKISQPVDLLQTATFAHWQNIVRKYYIRIDIKELVIDFSKEAVKQSFFWLMTYSINIALKLQFHHS
jgi:hypothetical protein